MKVLKEDWELYEYPQMDVQPVASRETDLIEYLLPKTCGECPHARHLDGDRYVCMTAVTSDDVVRKNWKPGTDCKSKFKEVKEDDGNVSSNDIMPSTLPRDYEVTSSRQALKGENFYLKPRSKYEPYYDVFVTSGEAKGLRIGSVVQSRMNSIFYFLNSRGNERASANLLELLTKAIDNYIRRSYNYDS